MAKSKKGVTARREDRTALPPATTARRVGWVVLAGAWLFVAVALVSYDSADAPSYAVAVHNDPAANLCGRVGAMIAHWSMHVLGAGSWVILAGFAGFLGVTVTGRVVGHPLLRFVGLLIAAVAVAAFHRLLLPDLGPLAGARGGVLAEFAVLELTPRFSTVGTGLLLLATLLLGAVVAADQLVLAVPRLVYRSLVATGRAGASLRRLGIRPEGRLGAGLLEKLLGRRHAEAEADEYEYEDEEEDEEEVEPEDEYEYEDEEEPAEEYEYEYVDEDEAEDEADAAEDGEVEAPPTRQTLSEDELRRKIGKLPLRLSAQSRTVAKDEDIPREESFEGYQFPTLDQLQDPENDVSNKVEAHVRKQAEKLEQAMNTYGIEGEVVGIESGPVVTHYSVQLAPGTKVAKVNAIVSDLARALSSHNIRIVPNTPGKSTIGVEVPNLHKEKVRLKELMSGGQAGGMNLPMFLGKDASGEPLVADLTRMPHMLIAGTTGSGKSVCINTILMSWMYTKRPNELKLVLVDPKMVELGQFADIPHLMCPVVTEMSRAAAILEWAVNKMEERYELLKEALVRDIAGYNALTEEELYERFEPASEEEQARIPKRLPYIVFVIDELADLILTHKEVEQHIVRIAQKARAVGIHLIVATQRPQANVVTGLIKSNMPCRISFKVASGMDSRIVLDQKGAELLLGQGDMLYLSPHTSEVQRAQGSLVTDLEIRKVVKFLKTVAAPSFERSLIAIRPGNADPDAEGKVFERDPLFGKAVEVIIDSGRGSVSLVQRRLAVGYSRASRLVDQMSMAGILGDHKGSVARDVLITMEEWQRMQELEEEQERDGTLFEGDGEDDGEHVAEIETVQGDREAVGAD